MHFNLSQEIINRSVSKHWDTAKLEWNFEYLYVSEDFQTCLCGHYPIRNICVIRNLKNSQSTEVGNCCVNKFLGIESGNKILDSLKRLKIDLEKSMSVEVLDYLRDKKVITKWDYKFYGDTRRKRIMSEKQLEHRKRINQKLIDLCSGETASAMGKILNVLSWAQDRSDFETGFVDSLRSVCERGGKLTEKQLKSLDNIITRFKIH